MHPDEHLSAEAERARYEQHNNSREDERYVGFLQNLAEPFESQLRAGANVLDYGSGPEPVLAMLLRESGHTVSIYDPFFADDKNVLQRRYDGIVCCETAEHFREPRGEWKKLAEMLEPGGVLGVMTLLLPSDADVSTWWYAQDPTHVVFYTERTIRWIAEIFDLDILKLSERVIIYRKRKRDSN